MSLLVPVKFRQPTNHVLLENAEYFFIPVVTGGGLLIAVSFQPMVVNALAQPIILIIVSLTCFPFGFSSRYHLLLLVYFFPAGLAGISD